MTTQTEGQKWVYAFTEGDGKDKQLLGGKGANLCEMTQIGLNVPPGFVITTEACLDYLEGDGLPDGLLGQVREQIGRLEKQLGKIVRKAVVRILDGEKTPITVTVDDLQDYLGPEVFREERALSGPRRLRWCPRQGLSRSPSTSGYSAPVSGMLNSPDQRFCMWRWMKSPRLENTAATCFRSIPVSSAIACRTSSRSSASSATSSGSLASSMSTLARHLAPSASVHSAR